MAKISNTSVADAFKAAKPFLRIGENDIVDNGKTTYICYALQTARNKKLISDRQLSRARNIIMYRLDAGKKDGAPSRGSVGSWLQIVARVPRKDLSYNNVQAYRHRWLDSLIEEFSQKG